MAWRVARGLETLLAQINEIAPNRNKASDGSIGDPAHCGPGAPPSDHCAKTYPGMGSTPVVTARDFTNDPARGADMNWIAERLRLSRDRRIKYVIWNRRIFSASNNPWAWRSYSGDNPHDRHMHVSVVPTSVADDTSDWEIDMALTNEDVSRVSDATTAKVLGRDWDIPGRTLAGSMLALLTRTTDQTATSFGAIGAKLDSLLARVPEDMTQRLGLILDEVDSAEELLQVLIDHPDIDEAQIVALLATNADFITGLGSAVAAHLPPDEPIDPAEITKAVQRAFRLGTDEEPVEPDPVG